MRRAIPFSILMGFVSCAWVMPEEAPPIELLHISAPIVVFPRTDCDSFTLNLRQQRELTQRCVEQL